MHGFKSAILAIFHFFMNPSNAWKGKLEVARQCVRHQGGRGSKIAAFETTLFMDGSLVDTEVWRTAWQNFTF